MRFSPRKGHRDSDRRPPDGLLRHVTVPARGVRTVYQYIEDIVKDVCFLLREGRKDSDFEEETKMVFKMIQSP